MPIQGPLCSKKVTKLMRQKRAVALATSRCWFMSHVSHYTTSAVHAPRAAGLVQLEFVSRNHKNAFLIGTIQLEKELPSI